MRCIRQQLAVVVREGHGGFHSGFNRTARRKDAGQDLTHAAEIQVNFTFLKIPFTSVSNHRQ
jgi:hypothetical protein